ncbi:Carboxypeptidase [hydrothermal vent metagenome]|uniref:Carboxypeptidase n=1 Tax=hydrothermal vent metagenome TaxID=652676 RepID=A0A1W1BAS6_9ZZZZ
MKHDFSTKEGTKEAIIWECRSQGLGLDTQIAYVIATAMWETAFTLKPVKEAFWKSEGWRKRNLRYYPYYGRGFVQLTWRRNYKKYSKIIGINMVSNPDIAMYPDIALFILVHGFKNGTFAGKKLSRYINNSKTDYLNARRCINGKDKAKKIAKLADKILVTLQNT